MAGTQSNFYECENPDCRLRFPGFEGHPRWNQCPACRSKIHVVATIDNEVEKIGNAILRNNWHLSALLDNIRSAWNVGSIFRTADGTGICRLYLCGITPTPSNPKVCKTALGAEANVPWEQSNNGLATVALLKNKGYHIWALENMPSAIPLFHIEEQRINYPQVLIVGNEVSGVDPGIIELCDKVVSIPMVGKKSSYNVATAFGIATNFLLYCQIFSQESRKIFPST